MANDYIDRMISEAVWYERCVWQGKLAESEAARLKAEEKLTAWGDPQYWQERALKAEGERDEAVKMHDVVRQICAEANVHHPAVLLRNLRAAEARLREVEGERDDQEKAREMHASLNRRAAKALGKPPEGEGSSWHDIPECIEALQARLRAVIEAAAPVEKYAYVLKRDGELLTYRCQGCGYSGLLLDHIPHPDRCPVAVYRRVRDAQPPAFIVTLGSPHSAMRILAQVALGAQPPASSGPSMYDYEGASDALGGAIKSASPEPEASQQAEDDDATHAEKLSVALGTICAYCGYPKVERPPIWCVREHQVAEPEANKQEQALKRVLAQIRSEPGEVEPCNYWRGRNPDHRCTVCGQPWSQHGGRDEK